MKKQLVFRNLAIAAAVAVVTACAGGGLEQEPRTDESAVAPKSAAPPPPRASREESAVAYRAAGQSIAASADMALTAGGCCPVMPTEPLDRENYADFDDNPLRLASEHPVSTFSIDVDTGAYANVRRFLNEGRLPPGDAVRTEELINYFRYDYATPASLDTPFHLGTSLAATPWNADTLLLRVGLKGFEVPARERPPANLVFLVDVSGSMRSPDKLPLLRDALIRLTHELDERDSVAIAGYAGGAGVILEPTSGADKRRIVAALDRLEAAGRTNGAAGIHLAYDLAKRGFIRDGINRVVLATDGDFNVGTVDFAALVDLVERRRAEGVALTSLGFGTGNYNDHLLEQIADAGNGNYAYIDSRREAQKVLVEELSSTLQTIASDVKIQVEFNPAMVAEYRLIGYENRVLRREDFNNDSVDAGEIGAGHTVTALYEITPHDSPARRIDPLRYGPVSGTAGRDGEIAFVRLRYKQPGSERSELIERVVTPAQQQPLDGDFGFAAAVAAFGQKLRGGEFLEGFDLDDIASLADRSLGVDPHGYRAEFVALVERAAALGAGRDGDRYSQRIAR